MAGTGDTLEFNVASMVEDILLEHGKELCIVNVSSKNDAKTSKRRDEATRWLRKSVGVVAAKDLPAEPSEENFRLGLRSGIILCNVLNKIEPGAVSKVVEAPFDSVIVPDGEPLDTSIYFDNIINFLEAVKERGLPTFEISDLELEGKVARVVNCVLTLKSYSEWKKGGANGEFKYDGKPKPSSKRKQIVRKSLDMDKCDLWKDVKDEPLHVRVRDLLSDKEPEDIPVVVEVVLSRLTEKFEKKLASQKEKMIASAKERNVLHANESLPRARNEDIKPSPRYVNNEMESKVRTNFKKEEFLKPLTSVINNEKEENARSETKRKEETKSFSDIINEMRKKANADFKKPSSDTKNEMEKKATIFRKKSASDINNEMEKKVTTDIKKSVSDVHSAMEKKATTDVKKSVSDVHNEMEKKATTDVKKSVSDVHNEMEKKATTDIKKSVSDVHNEMEKKATTDAKKSVGDVNNEMRKKAGIDAEKSVGDVNNEMGKKAGIDAKKSVGDVNKEMEEKSTIDAKESTSDVNKEAEQKATADAKKSTVNKEMEMMERRAAEAAKAKKEMEMKKEMERIAAEDAKRKKEMEMMKDMEQRAAEDAKFKEEMVKMKEEMERRAAEDAKKKKEIEMKIEMERKAAEDAKMKKDMERQMELERIAAEDLKRMKEIEMKIEIERKAAEDANMKLEMEIKKEMEWREAEDARRKIEMERRAAEDAKRKIEMERLAAEDAKEEKYYNWVNVECDRLKVSSTKQQKLVEHQQKELQALKTTFSTAKADMQLMLTNYQEQFNNLGKHLRNLAQAAGGYRKVVDENRKLYNQVQDLKGNIRVYCRSRPFLGQQRQSAVEWVDEGTMAVITPGKNGKDTRKLFTFNRVFSKFASQAEVYKDTQPLIRSVLDGYNVCIFAYGQTGSGKTHTMTGPENLTPETMGVNYRALNDLFGIQQERKNMIAYEVCVQMLEIYNETVRDLLNPDGASAKLDIRLGAANGINVPDANLVPVSTTDDVIRLMNLGHKNRAVGSTAMNNRSSRSHSCLTVHVSGKDLTTGSTVRGCMHLVDLAGSERADKTEATGDRLKEATHINKSLSALGDVIASLALKNAHVPYRNSKLTLLLQDALGGQAKTLMFIHVSPDPDTVGETISTLKFAERVSTVELGAAKSNNDTSDVKDLKEQVAFLKAALAKEGGDTQEAGSGDPESIDEGGDQDNDASDQPTPQKAANSGGAKPKKPTPGQAKNPPNSKSSPATPSKKAASSPAAKTGKADPKKRGK